MLIALFLLMHLKFSDHGRSGALFAASLLLGAAVLTLPAVLL